jgi:hypothetical protein
MPRVKAKDAENPAPVLHSSAQQAEEAMRERLKEDLPPVDYKTGSIRSNATLTPLWQHLKTTGGFSLGSVVERNPCTNPQATLEDHYKDGQKFAVFNPCVSVQPSRAATSSSSTSCVHQQNQQQHMHRP